LHLGNIEFDVKSFDDPIAPSKIGTIKNPEQVKVVANLLGIDDSQLLKALLANRKEDPGKKGKFDWVNLGHKKCCDNRDALAKQIFY
jgi:myosin heavy subunit